jgi:hypothetical protein
VKDNKEDLREAFESRVDNKLLESLNFCGDILSDFSIILGIDLEGARFWITDDNQ